jgi:ATP-dependent RNA helicase RhlE
LTGILNLSAILLLRAADLVFRASRHFLHRYSETAVRVYAGHEAYRTVIMSFDQLGLTDALLRAVAETGYDTPTPIQTEGIPPALAGRDVFGCAQTGTGKTAAFVLPILQRMDLDERPRTARRPVRALILTPTRELAAQIGESIATYGAQLPLTHTVIYGGVGQGKQVDALRKGVDILVACPGRMLDLMNQGLLKLDGIEYFVLDEADRMLDMGFIHDVRKIIAKLPAKRQTMFFSATVPREIRDLADSLLYQPVSIQVTPTSSTAETVEQAVYHVGRNRKAALLKHLLKDKEMSRILVFTRTKHGADRVAKILKKDKITAEAIHGNKSQNARIRALEAFKNGQARVLVASDIASRGIDIDEVTHVVNFELPHEPETYVHRIGRTGRAGNSGKAIAFCDLEERGRLKGIQRLIKQDIPVVDDHPYVGSEHDDPPREERPQRPPRAKASGPRREGGGGGGGAGGGRGRSSSSENRGGGTGGNRGGAGGRARRSGPRR